MPRPRLALRRRRPQAVHLPLPPGRHRDLRRRPVAHRGCGRVLELSTNFRSTAGLCDWVNRVFSRLRVLPEGGNGAAGGLRPALSPSIRTRHPAPPSSVSTRRSAGNAEQPVADRDASRIADFIAAAIASGERRPEDFLLLFRRRKFMAGLRARPRGAGHRSARSAAARPSAPPRSSQALMPALEVLADPDNPVPLVAALRGPLFGVDDEALYRFARAGGRFSFRAAPPSETDPRIERALRAARAKERRSSRPSRRPPRSRASPRSSAGRRSPPRGTSERAAPETCSRRSPPRASPRRRVSPSPRVVEELARLREEDLIEQMSLEPGRPGAVRLLTLHGAKGLEAPVVFLADPTKDQVPAARLLHRPLRRAAAWATSSCSSESGSTVGRRSRVRPAGTPCSRSRRPSTTRRRSGSSTSARPAPGRCSSSASRETPTEKAAGPWAALDRHLPENLSERAPAAPEEGAPSLRRAPESGKRFTGASRSAAPLCVAPGYAVASVTTLAHEGAERPFRERTGKGMSWGSASIASSRR